MRNIFPGLLTAMTLLIFACQQPNSQLATATSSDFNTGDTGVRYAGIKMIPVQTPIGTFKVWTKRFGNNPSIKVLLLHGGPAMTHEYMECFESYFPGQGIEFYEYDQLGSYYSDQPTDSSLWTIDHFVDEVEQVRKALSLDKSNFFLLGNSWGGMLALEYAFKYQDNLKGLLICNMMASCPEYGNYAENVLAQQMDPKVLDTIRQLEARKAFQDPKYMELLMANYYNQHICRLPELPEPVMRSFKHLNNSIYTLMQGPSEFGIGGRLANWDRRADLPKIKVPTLTVGAKHDTMDPEHMKWMSTQVQNGTYLFCPNGSHLSMWDDQRVFMNGVIDFIKKVDAASVKK
ncbi:proline iminopeptidase-family hydrolase [Paraflavitalea sp. CAU 1676]|uniref:proline iminopeptidase-family hydrolase n=1 Tax=Paraflavitalea sp. CAU 1676 TaxID=3032598 RepID=UPI0023DC8AC6|nr:proline iminopeptidase-family hydrolase [Paraflavitalea sp. CAU 1676]MDF2192728.1 proline iminopeptidase-family hydrolase [Paraflavitalea sp. CAU 1676]